MDPVQQGRDNYAGDNVGLIGLAPSTGDEHTTELLNLPHQDQVVFPGPCPNLLQLPRQHSSNDLEPAWSFNDAISHQQHINMENPRLFREHWHGFGEQNEIQSVSQAEQWRDAYFPNLYAHMPILNDISIPPVMSQSSYSGHSTEEPSLFAESTAQSTFDGSAYDPGTLQHAMTRPTLGILPTTLASRTLYQQAFELDAFTPSLRDPTCADSRTLPWHQHNANADSLLVSNDTTLWTPDQDIMIDRNILQSCLDDLHPQLPTIEEPSSRSRIRKQAGTQTILQQRETLKTHDETEKCPKFEDELKVHLYTNPTDERKHRKLQKRTRRIEGRMARRACFRCRIYNRRCTTLDDGPCTECKAWIERHTDQPLLSKFTCDIQTKFAEMNLFSAPPAWLTGADHNDLSDTFIKAVDKQKLVRPLLELFVPIINSLEPSEPRSELWKADSDMAYHCYIQSILRWKEPLLNFRIGTIEQINLLESLHRDTSRWVLSLLDQTKVFRNKLNAVSITGLVYNSIDNLRLLDAVDQAVVAHFQSAIESRLTFLCGTLFPDQPITDDLAQVHKIAQAAILGSCLKLTRFLPVQYQIDPSAWAHTESETHRYLRCPIQIPKREDRNDLVARPPCFCSWVLDWLPMGCLQCFKSDVEHFSRTLHDDTHLWPYIPTVFCQVVARSENDFNNITNAHRHAARLTFRSVFERTKRGQVVSDLVLCRIVYSAMALAYEFMAELYDMDDDPKLGEEFLSILMDDYIAGEGSLQEIDNALVDHIKHLDSQITD